jgi:hypothetical protein
MAHGEAREGNWRGNWRMEWVASTLHTTSELGVSSITTADAHTSAASSRLNWRPRRFKRTRPFRRKMTFGFCACAITFQTSLQHSRRRLRNMPCYRNSNTWTQLFFTAIHSTDCQFFFFLAARHLESVLKANVRFLSSWKAKPSTNQLHVHLHQQYSKVSPNFNRISFASNTPQC